MESRKQENRTMQDITTWKKNVERTGLNNYVEYWAEGCLID